MSHIRRIGEENVTLLTGDGKGEVISFKTGLSIIPPQGRIPIQTPPGPPAPGARGGIGDFFRKAGDALIDAFRAKNVPGDAQGPQEEKPFQFPGGLAVKRSQFGILATVVIVGVALGMLFNRKKG